MRTTETIQMNDIGPLTALKFVQTNDLEKVVPSAGFLADQRCTKSELLIFERAFAGSGERSIQSQPYPHASRHLTTPARQLTLMFASSPTHAHVRLSGVPSTGADRCEISQGEGADRAAPAHRIHLQLSSRVARLARSTRRSRRIGARNPVKLQRTSRPLARARAPRSAARQPRLLAPPGPCLPLPLTRPPGSRQQP